MIPPDRNRNIVDIVLDIMDRGPRPMKNLKVTEKNRNCVDRFWDAHQAEYEAREKLSKHDVERVKQHNMTYPRLGFELSKRKSLSKVRTIQQNNDSSTKHNDLEWTADSKLRRLSQLQKNTLKPKYIQRKKKSKTRYRDSKSGVQKNSNKNKKRVKSRKTISVNKKIKCRCYYYILVKHKRVGTDLITNLQVKPKYSKQSNEISIERMISTAGKFNEASKERINSRERIDSLMPKRESVNDLKTEDERSEHSTIKTLNNPDTSVASVTTFNTLASLDQEPMVNMEL